MTKVTSATPVSAMAASIEQLRERLETANNPDGLDIKTHRFQINHQSETGTIISLRGAQLDLNPLLNVAELGLRVTSLDTHRSGTHVVAVFLLNPIASGAATVMVIEEETDTTDPDGEQDRTHYISETVAVCQTVDHYTGAGGAVHTGTYYNVKPLGEAPDQVRYFSRDYYIDVALMNNVTWAKMVPVAELPLQVQAFFK